MFSSCVVCSRNFIQSFIIFRVSSFPFCFVLFLYSCVAHFAWENFLNSSSVSFFPLPDFPSIFLYSFPRFSLYFFLSVFFFPLQYPHLSLCGYFLPDYCCCCLFHPMLSLQWLSWLLLMTSNTFNLSRNCGLWEPFNINPNTTLGFNSYTPVRNRLLRLFGIDFYVYLASIYSPIFIINISSAQPSYGTGSGILWNCQTPLFWIRYNGHYMSSGYEWAVPIVRWAVPIQLSIGFCSRLLTEECAQAWLHHGPSPITYVQFRWCYKSNSCKFLMNKFRELKMSFYFINPIDRSLNFKWLFIISNTLG